MGTGASAGVGRSVGTASGAAGTGVEVFVGLTSFFLSGSFGSLGRLVFNTVVFALFTSYFFNEPSDVVR